MPPPFTTTNPPPDLPSIPSLPHLHLPTTPLVRSALHFAASHLSHPALNHVTRSWLFAALIARSAKLPHLHAVDPEVLALSTLLHDLGWDPTGACASPDRRFEVDGADAAVRWLEAHAPPGWDDGGESASGVRAPGGCRGRKAQQVWDAIALHTTGSVVFWKEPPVAAAAFGIWADFQGPDRTVPAGILSWEEYDAVVKEYPRLGLMSEVKELMCGFCRTKPQTTYDNTVGEWGEMFVEGYTRKGKTTAEMLLQCDLDEREVS
ncbi:hypothetical protein C8J57DRAFT_1296538 [Neofusicoccum parvum]|nr:hypothetical protein C8J57DRAFT_1296538 [Neofusicoccum parvum]